MIPHSAPKTNLSLMDFLLNELRFLKNQERILLREIFAKTKDIKAFQKQDFSEILCRPLRGGSIDWIGKIRLAEQNYLDFLRGLFGASVWGSHDYPLALEYCDDAPYMLFYRGLLPPKENNAVGIVGTRKPTAQGRRAARRAGASWASSGYTVVSGLAWGIDGEAHLGCLEAQGRTLAIMGTGIDKVYPTLHKKLAHRILDEGGALISEYGRGAPGGKHQFPLRNRVISGLSRGVLLIEAPERSGALGTLEWAMDQGREIWLQKECLNSPQGAGLRRAAEQGAKVISEPSEVIPGLAPELWTKSHQEADWQGYWDLQRSIDQEPNELESLMNKTLGSTPGSGVRENQPPYLGKARGVYA
jgi:DNA processing protein